MEDLISTIKIVASMASTTISARRPESSGNSVTVEKLSRRLGLATVRQCEGFEQFWHGMARHGRTQAENGIFIEHSSARASLTCRLDELLLAFAGGALLLLMAVHYDLSVIAIVGIILLIGIVKKNGIMLVDFALQAEHNDGLTAEESIYRACVQRFRPILMTTMAALLGGVPMMLGTRRSSSAFNAAKAAIDRYFEDRNANFLQHPKRAGRKMIWGNVAQVSDAGAGGNGDRSRQGGHGNRAAQLCHCAAHGAARFARTGSHRDPA